MSIPLNESKTYAAVKAYAIDGEVNALVDACYRLEVENAALSSLLREAVELIDPYDLPEGSAVVERVKAALKEAKP